MIEAADCHFHIIDHRRFPFSGRFGYTPKPDEIGTYQNLKSCWGRHGITHGLAVQPSGYGYDNSAMIDALRLSGGCLKGIAVVRPEISEKALLDLAADGVTGIRLNFTDFESEDSDKTDWFSLLERISAMGWFVDLQCHAREFLILEPILSATESRILFDHLGRPDPAKGIREPGFQRILNLADRGTAVVKLSGAFRESAEPYPYSDMEAYVAAILEAYTPDLCVWGSDWPFINLTSKPDYAQSLACLERCLPDEAMRRKVLWETPSRLFGFR